MRAHSQLGDRLHSPTMELITVAEARPDTETTSAVAGPATETVDTAVDAERRPRTDVAIDHLAVIAGGLHDPHPPVLGHAELFAEIAVSAEDAFQLRILQFGFLVDILRGPAELFGGDHGKQ